MANLPPVSLIPMTVCHRCRWHRRQICRRYRWHWWQICHRYQQHYWNWWQNFCRRCRWHRWSTFSCEYLREFSKKFETALMVYSGAWGKLIHEKNQKSKISWHCPFKYFIYVGEHTSVGCIIQKCLAIFLACLAIYSVSCHSPVWTLPVTVPAS